MQQLGSSVLFGWHNRPHLRSCNYHCASSYTSECSDAVLQEAHSHGCVLCQVEVSSFSAQVNAQLSFQSTCAVEGVRLYYLTGYLDSSDRIFDIVDLAIWTQ